MMFPACGTMLCRLQRNPCDGVRCELLPERCLGLSSVPLPSEGNMPSQGCTHVQRWGVSCRLVTGYAMPASSPPPRRGFIAAAEGSALAKGQPLLPAAVPWSALGEGCSVFSCGSPSTVSRLPPGRVQGLTVCALGGNSHTSALTAQVCPITSPLVTLVAAPRPGTNMLPGATLTTGSLPRTDGFSRVPHQDGWLCCPPPSLGSLLPPCPPSCPLHRIFSISGAALRGRLSHCVFPNAGSPRHEPRRG